MEGRRGLTMIEVLATLGVMAAIAALALPAFGSWLDSARVDSVVAQIGAAVQKGRQVARDTGKPASLTGDARSRGVTLAIETGKGDAARVLGQMPVEFTLVSGAAKPEDSKGEAPNATRIAVCLPDGTVDGAGVVLSVRGREYAIVVSRWTGSVTAVERAKKPENESVVDERPAATGDAP